MNMSNTLYLCAKFFAKFLCKNCAICFILWWGNIRNRVKDFRKRGFKMIIQLSGFMILCALITCLINIFNQLFWNLWSGPQSEVKIEMNVCIKQARLNIKKQRSLSNVFSLLAVINRNTTFCCLCPPGGLTNCLNI